MTLAAILQQALSDELCRQGQAGLIVWYDPGGTLRAVVERAMPEGAQLLSFEDSYLALRFALETEDPHFQKRWIVYIPEAPPRESWLRDWELLGTRWEMDLLQLLHRQVNLPLTPKLTELLRRCPQNARDLAQAWESLIGGQGINETNIIDAMLALGFGLPHWQAEEGVLLFLSGAVGRQSLEARGLWTVFGERVAQWTGWEEVPGEEEDLRRRLEATVLLAELVSALPGLADRFSGVLPAEPNRRLAASLARTWRDRENRRDSYLQAAQRVEREYGLGMLLSAQEALLNMDTFPVIDELWRREVHNAVAPDGSNFQELAPRLAEIAGQRTGLFWAREGRAAFWTPVALAARLAQGCTRAVEEALEISLPNEFIRSYTADEGWWRLDLWALELAARAQALRPDERSRLAYPAWRAYGKYLDQINRLFAAAVERGRWIPAQTGFWQRFIQGGGGARTAVFLVDALRYDLARRLVDLLSGGEFTLTLDALPGVLPGVTEMGMAALLPGAEAGLEVAAEETGLRVRLNGAVVGQLSERKRWFESRLGARAAVVKLDELGEVDLGGAAVVVVLSREIDRFGTFAADLNPEGLLAMVQQVARGIHRLKEQGFERFLVVADHGFLFLPPQVEAQRLASPTAKICKERFAVGGGGPGCLVKRAEELSLGGSEVFAFPLGLTVFALPGESRAFLHGGLSLQEAVVPVIDARAAAGWQKVAVVMEPPAQLTSRVAVVRLRAEEVTLFARPRRVIVEIRGRRSDPKELGAERRQETVSLVWLGFDEAPPQQATVRLLDADSSQVLAEAAVTVNMVL